MIMAAIVLVAGLVAWGVWAKVHGSDGAAASPAEMEPGEGPPALPTDLAPRLERWVEAGLISRQQADAIAAHEGSAVPAAPPAERRISLIAEALGYVGTVLALAGAGVGLGQAWEDIPTWSHLAIAAGAAVLLLVGGWALLRQTEAAFRRLQSVLWFLSVGAAAWALALLGVEVLEWEEPEPAVLLTGAGTAALAASLWAVRHDPLQHIALSATLHVALIGAILCLPGEAPLWSYALAVWALGAGWALLGWRRALQPWWLALALGSVGAAVGPAIGLDPYPWLLALALGTSISMMVVSVPTGQVPLLAVGTLATFGYLTWAVVRYFKESIGVALALVIVGAIFIALAVVAGRLTQVTRGKRLRSRAARRAE